MALSRKKITQLVNEKETEDKSTHNYNYNYLLLIYCPETYIGEETTSLTNGAGNLVKNMQKNEQILIPLSARI